jgi:gas vesicle protein
MRGIKAMPIRMFRTMTAGAAVAAIVAMGTAPAIGDEERVDHYRGLPAETLEEAVTNFSEYNTRLAAVLDKPELTAEDLESVHEITYTLENALEKINAEMDELAETLEALHLASETDDPEGTKSHGADYLETARTIIP